jgi:WhiB family redox-sensing transcriptional regulator
VLNESVSLGQLARPGVRESIDVSVPMPAWLKHHKDPEPLPCIVDPELFFPLKYNLTCQEQIAEAKAVCLSCPMRALCLEDALEKSSLDGIWAATTPMERRRLRKKRRPSQATAKNSKETAA